MNAPIVFLDTETTSLDPTTRRPWDIGLIRRAHGRESRTTIFVSDVDLNDANLDSLNIGRFYERHPLFNGQRAAFEAGLRTCVPVDTDVWLAPEHIVADMVDTLTSGRANIVGIVPSFDTTTLDAMLRRHRREPQWHYYPIDVGVMALGWLNGLVSHGHSSASCYDSPNCNADELPLQLPFDPDVVSRACGVEPPSGQLRHTGIGDADWTLRWYDTLTAAAEVLA